VRLGPLDVVEVDSDGTTLVGVWMIDPGQRLLHTKNEMRHQSISWGAYIDQECGCQGGMSGGLLDACGDEPEDTLARGGSSRPTDRSSGHAPEGLLVVRANRSLFGG
jgi:hypothetical protein